jgi:hypothetical protein
MATEIWPKLGDKSSKEKVEKAYGECPRVDERRINRKPVQNGPQWEVRYILEPFWAIVTLEILYDM